MHVAAGLKKKQVVLNGPTNSQIWGPLNPNARLIQSSCPQCPCLKLGFEYHTYDGSCMKKIEIEEVKSTILSLIDNKRAI
jgi:ADP-heptose:LPS heptosyltransferase